MNRPRGNRQRMRGLVVSDKAAKTAVVEVARQFWHPKYKKMVRRRGRLAVHDEKDEARVGDLVEIVSCRPMSRTKRWRVVAVLARGAGAAAAEPPAAPETAPAP